MADQNVTAGIRGVQALADKENELRRVKETLAREQREKAAAEAKLAAAEARLKTMVSPSHIASGVNPSDPSLAVRQQMAHASVQAAAQAHAARQAMYNQMAAGGWGNRGAAQYAAPIGPAPLATFGQPGAASPWNAQGAAYRAAQAQQGANAQVGTTAQWNAQSNAMTSFARGVAGAAIGITGMTSAVIMAKNAMEDMARTRSDKFKGAAEKNLAVSEAARAGGMSKAQEDALRKTVFSQSGQLTVTDKARLADIAAKTNTGDMGLINREDPGSTQAVIAAADRGEISMEQAEKILSGDKSLPFSMGLDYQRNLGPQQGLSDKGKKALADTQIEARALESNQFPMGQRLTREQMLERFRTNKTVQRNDRVERLGQEGRTMAKWWEQSTGWLSDMFTSDEDIIVGNTAISGGTAQARDRLVNLSDQTLLKAQLKFQEMQYNETRANNVRASTSVPNPIEGL